MAKKKLNPLLIGGIGVSIACLSLVMCSEKVTTYEPLNQVPGYNADAKREDGDTQTDTIKALQAYAREAIQKADTLHESTKKKMEQVTKNQHKVTSLERDNAASQETMKKSKVAMNSLEQSFLALKREISELRRKQNKEKPTPSENSKPNDLPSGFGFDEEVFLPVSLNEGEWFNSVEWAEPDETSSNRFSGLLRNSKNSSQSNNKPKLKNLAEADAIVEPFYTIPKDATLSDGLALTALIGRIPVEGDTPDPYPVKIYIGRENLLANGHEIPEIEGMIFSGLGFGDWNLSCVNVRLTSATYIFEDGTIVNHGSDGGPLGYISDPSGVP